MQRPPLREEASSMLARQFVKDVDSKDVTSPLPVESASK
jgi:hypothetical protein